MSTREGTGAAGERASSASHSGEAVDSPEAVESTETVDSSESPRQASARPGLSKQFTNEAAYVRLRSELGAALPELELLVTRTDSEGEPWARHGRELLEAAKRDLNRGDIDEAWRHLHTARRFEVYGLEKLAEADGRARNEGAEDSRSELEIRAAAVREEALDTLDGWRRRAVVDILCDGTEALKQDVSGPELRTATRLLHEHYESVYLSRSERQRQFNQLVLMGALSGLVLLLLTLADWAWSGGAGLTGAVGDFLVTPFGASTGDAEAPGFAVFMTVAGVMGASLFGMRSLRNRSLSTSIPQQIRQFTVTGARGVIGAISALLFYFVLQTPLLHDGTILADGVITPSLMVVVGFAAGYTERMAPEVVAKVASITDSEGTDGSKPTE